MMFTNFHLSIELQATASEPMIAPLVHRTPSAELMVVNTDASNVVIAAIDVYKIH